MLVELVAIFPRRQSAVAHIDGTADTALLDPPELLLTDNVVALGNAMIESGAAALAELAVVPHRNGLILLSLNVKSHPTTPAARGSVIRLAVAVGKRGRSRSGLPKFGCSFRGTYEGHLVAAGSFVCCYADQDAYARVRDARSFRGTKRASELPPRLSEPLNPRQVGRRQWRNVLLGQLHTQAWQASGVLCLPFNHPAHFRLPLDHVPGMVFVEAASQAITAYHLRHGLPTRVSSFNMRFLAIAELAREIHVHLSQNSTTADKWHVVFDQDETQVATGTFGYASGHREAAVPRP
ncbi:AfsA-related hotdog domain-containing protein [Amycolatopsis sp. cmx-11-12]|uniref:AfsA-related hotdog domain-containing protein n=1 Tax=Amycolatopsis sp. cmx-11-12 TaxID=2785795 RepID=UPI00391847C6